MMDEKKLSPEEQARKLQDAAKSCELDDDAMEGVAGGLASALLGEIPENIVK